MRCALCGRPVLNPVVLIANLPVGPKCAKRANLLAPAKKRIGRLSLFTGSRVKRQSAPETMDLFAEVDQ